MEEAVQFMVKEKPAAKEETGFINI